MKKTANTIHRASALLLTAAVLCGAIGATSSMSASAAADAPSLDFTQSAGASITVNFTDGTAAVKGGEFTLYQVATLGYDDGNMAYTYTDQFSALAGDSKYSLDSESLASTDATALLAKNISGWVSDNSSSLTSLAVQSNQTGTIVFESTSGGYTIDLGLYLIVQTGSFDGYKSISSFLVSVPLAADDGNGGSYWVYNVNATPKMEVLETEAATETEAQTESETTQSETESETEAQTESETEAATETETDPQTETTETESESETEKLPQTGQLNWPIPVLCGAGAFLILAGLILTLSDRRNRKHGA